MALIMAAGMATAETWNSPVYELSGNTITVSGNVSYPTVKGDDYNDVCATASGTVTITGSGTVSAPDTYESYGALYFEKATSVTLDEEVTFRNFGIEIYSGEATLKGTYQASSIWFGGTINLSQATLAPYDGEYCSVEFSPNSKCIAENLVVSATTTDLLVYGNDKTSPGANPVLQGNLTISGSVPTVNAKGQITAFSGGYIEFSKYSREQNYSTLVVTGSITVTQNTEVDFYNEDLFDSAPSPQDDIFICSSVEESQLGYLKPFLVHEQEEGDENIFTSYDGHFTAQTEADGKVHIRLAEGGGSEPTPGPTPEPEKSIPVDAGQTVVLGESVETTPAADNPVYMNGGTADATKLADSLLNNTIFIGNGGMVLTKSGQHTTLTGTDTVHYNMEGKDSARGGDLAVGTASGAHSNIQLKGDSYKVGAFTVQNGLASIGSRSTLDAASTTVNAGGSITNFGSVSGNVELAAAGATMLNQGEVNDDITLRNGSTLVNNGRVYGDTEIAGGAAAFGSGMFASTHVLTGGNLHIGNSPGYQYHNHLTLGDGASLYFCVDGVRQATLADNGNGTYSHLVAETLTLNGTQNIDVEVGLNFITAVLLDRTATLKIAEFGTVDGSTPLDDQAFTYTVTDTTGLLEGGELTTDGNSLSFTGTVGDEALAALAGSHGTQVANTMWASTSLLNDFADMAEARLAGKMEEGTTAAWAGGLGSFQRETEHAAGYTYNGGGYALGVQHAFMRDFAAGVAFGQSFGHFEARDNSLKARQRGVMPAITARYRANSGKGAVNPVVTAHVAYGDMKYKADTYGLLPGHAEWTDRTLSAGITVGTEIKVGVETTVTPFVGLSYAAADQKDAVEDMGAISRRYHDGKMHNLSIPVGVTLRSTMGAFTPEVTIAYRADVDRSNPEVQCDCLGIKSTAEGADPGKHSMYLNAGGTYAVSDNVGIFASYTLNVREHATNQSVNAGVQVSF